MINFIKCNDVKEIHNVYYQYELNSFWTTDEVDIDLVYFIYHSNILIGLVQLSFGKYRNGRKYANVDMIELFSNYKGIGYGKIIVSYLFDRFSVSTLTGDALPSAIPFWRGIGADFYVSDNKLREYYIEGYDAVFKLTKNMFDRSFN